jgi:hypothetical protein
MSETGDDPTIDDVSKEDQAILDEFLRRDRVAQLRRMLSALERDSSVPLGHKAALLDWLWKHIRRCGYAEEVEHLGVGE